MLQNYLRTAYRALFRHPAFTAINLLGLSSGLAICLFMIALVLDQNGYDQFHANANRIYRVVSDDHQGEVYAACPPVLREKLQTIPTIEGITRMKHLSRVDVGLEQAAFPTKALFVDPEFIELFDFDYQGGKTEIDLSKPYQIVIRDRVATTLGLDPARAIGETVRINDWGPFQVSGVITDTDLRSHLTFDVLISYSTEAALIRSEKVDWGLPSWNDTWNTYLYVQLNEANDRRPVQSALQAISANRYADAERKIDFALQPLAQITPTKRMSNELAFTLPAFILRLLSLLALAVILLACFNYTNLSVAQGLNRANEIGVRRVLGAQRRSILFQFTAEAVLLSFLALGLALAFLWGLIVPTFSTLQAFSVFEFQFQLNEQLLLYFVGFALLTGILAGILPAIYLSGLTPQRVLRQVRSVRIFSRLGIRKVLLVAQFAITMVFVVSILLLYQQAQKQLQADYGFHKEHLVQLNLQGHSYEEVRTQYANLPEVTNISASSIPLASGHAESRTYYQPNSDQERESHLLYVDDQFTTNFGVEMLAGRSFAEDGRLNQAEVIVNELLVKENGWESPAAAIGQPLELPGGDSVRRVVSIIGVVPNFIHFRLTSPNRPLLILQNEDRFQYANLRIRPEALSQAETLLARTWQQIDPTHPIEYRFVEESIFEDAQIMQDMAWLIGIFCSTAVLISCMGLLGMASYLVRLRRREISIRTVFGAPIRHTLWILSRGLLLLVGLAILIAAPAAYFINRMWLDTLINTVPIDFSNLGVGLVSVFLLALLIILSQAYRIALSKPAEVLRND